MYIEPAPPKKSRVLRIALIASAAFHVILIAGFLAIATGAVPKSYTVDMVFNAPKPEPTPPPKVEPTPPPPPPPKQKALPPPNQNVKTPPSAEPPKPIFGVTKDSVVDGDSAVAMRVGNTLMKEPEKNFTDPSKVKPYGASDVVSQSELDHPPKVKHMVQPEYPALAKRTNREGVVRVRFLVNKDGHVSNVKVLSAPTGLGFEDAAVAAVQAWLFETPTVQNRPVSAWIVQSIRFQME
jgi:protein TonB